MVLLNNDRQDAPPATARAAVTTAFRHCLSMQWWITAPLPLKVAYFGLACAAVFGLAAAIAGFEFGREAEDQVVDVTEDLLTIASLGGGPVLIMGLISSFARRQRTGDPMAPKRPPGDPMTLGNILHARLASGRIYFQPDPSISCQGCSPNAPFAKLEMLTAESA